jgi:hypothetical protein
MVFLSSLGREGKYTACIVLDVEWLALLDNRSVIKSHVGSQALLGKSTHELTITLGPHSLLIMAKRSMHYTVTSYSRTNAALVT